MAHDDPRYLSVSSTWPEVIPPISRAEAERAARKIYRKFGAASLGGPSQLSSAKFSGNVRRCWVSLAPTTGHHKGWGRLAHDISHHIFRRRHPSFRPHDGGHATLEREIAEYVLASGWLTGSLKPCPPTRAELDTEKAARTAAALRRWNTKLKRAQTAIRKLQRRQRILETRRQRLACHAG